MRIRLTLVLLMCVAGVRAQTVITVPGDYADLGLALAAAGPSDIIELDGGTHSLVGTSGGHDFAGLVAKPGTDPIILDSHLEIIATGHTFNLKGLAFQNSSASVRGLSGLLPRLAVENVSIAATQEPNILVASELSIDGLSVDHDGPAGMEGSLILAADHGSVRGVRLIRTELSNFASPVLRPSSFEMQDFSVDGGRISLAAGRLILIRGSISGVSSLYVESTAERGSIESVLMTDLVIGPSAHRNIRNVNVLDSSYCESQSHIKLLDVDVARTLFCRNGSGVIEVEPASEVTISESAFLGNVGPLFLERHPRFVRQTTFSGNAEFSSRASNAADFAGNYWGHSSGPRHTTQNPGGLGDEASVQVNVVPWLVAPNPNAPTLASVAIEQPGEVTRRLLYPNPATRVVTLVGVGEDAEILVFDMLGRRALIGRGTKLDVSGLAPGLYAIASGSEALGTILRR